MYYIYYYNIVEYFKEFFTLLGGKKRGWKRGSNIFGAEPRILPIELEYTASQCNSEYQCNVLERKILKLRVGGGEIVKEFRETRQISTKLPRS